MPNKLPEKKSPLKERPPRQAGQSVQNTMDDFLVDRMLSWFFVPIAFGICTVMFWVVWLLRLSIETAAWTVAALFIISVPIAIYKIYSARHEFRRLKQGRDGERTVGALLEELRKDDYRIFHDIPNAKKTTFNIDHVLIGPGGVFTIETKTFSKVGTRKERIRYENNELIIPGIGRGDDTAKQLHQAKAAADFLSKYLAKTTGYKVPVQPMLIFPGWFVEESPPTARPGLPVWVINEKRIFDWITKAPECLTRQDISLYTHRLRMHLDDCYD